MKITYGLATLGIVILVISIIGICVVNFQTLYTELQHEVPTGCIDVNVIGAQYSFTGTSILTWTLICCAFMIIQFLLFLAIRGAASRREKLALTKLCIACVIIGILLLYSTYTTYSIVKSLYLKCSVDILNTISILNMLFGAIPLAISIVCLISSFIEGRRYVRYRRL